ncbi:MAG: divergent polysaccharide deacetylase family protein [Pseudomonadota bacterium]
MNNLWISAAAADNLAPAMIAVVIDDIGYDRRRGVRAIALPGVTVAVMPFTPNADYLARLAHESGREVIIHQPMQGRRGSRHAHGTLTLGMAHNDLITTLDAAVANVPFAVGLSNHTGSVFTADRSSMDALMRRIADHELYYLDSRTTRETVAGGAAGSWGVPFLSRDVFLDHEDHTPTIERQFELALSIARRRGHVVLVGHPREKSLAVLERRLARLDPTRYELVPASELIGLPHHTSSHSNGYASAR